MKILSVRLSNLNSLRGEHVVDLRTPPLSTAGLFLITGPTGSGKSTILDAITLGLYGRAARYGANGNADDMMSRHCGDCSAEVEFRTRGKEYRVTWRLKRARGLAEGKIQPPVRILVDLETGREIASKVKEVAEQIEQLTGLDYERFLRSVMLAQGQFAAFLKSSENERSALLEAITGTSSYSEISILAYEIAQQKEKVTLTKEGELSGAAALNEEERGAKEAELKSLAAEAETQAGSLNAAKGELNRMLEASDLQRDRLQLSIEQEGLERRQKESAKCLESLATHRRVIPFMDDLLKWKSCLEALQQTEESAGDLSRKETEARLGLERTAAFLKSAEDKAAEAAREQQKDQPLFEEILVLDADLAKMSRACAEATATVKERTEECSVMAKQQQEHQALCLTHQKRLDALIEWRTEHAKNESIGAELDALKGGIATWKRSLEEKTQLEIEIEKLTKRQTELSERISNQSCEVEETQRKHHASLEKAAELEKQIQAISEGRTQEQLATRRQQLTELLGVLLELKKAVVRESELIASIAKGRESETRARKEFEVRQVNMRVFQEQAAQLSLELAEARKALATYAEVLSLEERRQDLREGEPCPLCGAPEHPYCTGVEWAASGKTQFERRVIELDQSLAECHTRLHKEGAIAGELKGQLEQFAVIASSLEAELGALRQTIAKLVKSSVEPAALSGYEAAVQEELNSLAVRMSKITRLQEDSNQAKASSSNLGTRLAELTTGVKGNDVAREELGSQLATLATKDAALHERVASLPVLPSLKRLGFKASSFSEAERLVLSAMEQWKEWEKQRLAVDQERGEVEKQRGRIEYLAEGKSVAEKHLATAQAELERRMRDWETNRKIRTEKFGDRDVREAQELLRQKVITAAAQARQAADEYAKANRAWTESSTRKAANKAEFEKEKASQTQIEASLRPALEAVGFQGFSQPLEARLRTDELSAAENLEKQLASDQHRLAERLRANGERQAKLSGIMCDPDKIRLQQSRCTDLENEQGARKEQIGMCREVLRRDAEAREQSAKLGAELRDLKTESARWKRLSDLIGSASGAAFAKFAQGLTLGRLIGLANHHLARLNARYLIRAKEQGMLQLEILDRYQGDAVRPTESLSGGETFLVSLALALGVSELASRNSSIDSLFIDEGFGSLDANTLETAMAAFENLQARGKTIGLISHIELMKERIGTQICVTRDHNGRGRFEVK